MRQICLLVVSLLLPIITYAESIESKCIEKSEHDGITFFLIDRSDNLEDKDGFLKTVAVLKDMIQSGERLLVGVSADKAGSTRILMDFAKPTESVWTSTLKIRAQQKKFNDCLDSVTSELANKEEKHANSALLETISFISKIIAADNSVKKRLIIYSDMMQNSSSISFYSQKSLNAAAILKLLEKERLLVELPKVEVYTAGTGAHVADGKARDLEEIWRAYFQKAGAIVKFYGPILVNMG